MGCKRELTDLPQVDKSSAYGFVRKQTSFGPRVPSTEAHVNCKNWLVEQFKSHGMEVETQEFTAQTFDGKTHPAFNIIARSNPKAKQTILWAAHWDSRPFADHDEDSSKHKQPILGADDGASGVAVLLELSRLINQKKLNKVGVEIVLFDAEDYGNDNGSDPLSWCLGSQHWSKEAKAKGFKADYGILLDMVGGTNPLYTYDEASKYYAPRVLEKVWSIAKEEGYEANFKKILNGAITDDHVFVNQIAGIPMIDIINRPAGSKTGFVSHWHTHKDDDNSVDPNSLEMVTKILLKLLYLEDIDKI